MVVVVVKQESREERGTRHARVKKKFQWTPYSETCSWYSSPLLVARRIPPKMSKGTMRLVQALKEGRRWRATKPAATTKDPAPKSMSPYPETSVLANRLGKTRKSTANIATNVRYKTEDR